MIPLSNVWRKAKLFFRRALLKKKVISFKGEIDLVTTVDKAIEDKVIEIIRSQYPDHDILAEESQQPDHSSPYRWIIDPLDGTVNFAHNVPFFSLSIALEYNKELILGVVYHPMAQELFTAEKGKGAYLNGKKISVSTISDLSQSLLATGFPYDCHQHADLYVSEFKKMVKKAQGIRRPGVASLDICYVATGRFDGFWERKLKPWDVAASLLIVEEAGGKITTFYGKEYCFSEETLLVSNGLIHEEMLSILSTTAS